MISSLPWKLRVSSGGVSAAAPLSDSDSMRRKQQTHFSGPKRLPESALRDDAELEPLLLGGSRRSPRPSRKSDSQSTNSRRKRIVISPTTGQNWETGACCGGERPNSAHPDSAPQQDGNKRACAPPGSPGKSSSPGSAAQDSGRCSLLPMGRTEGAGEAPDANYNSRRGAR